MYNPISTYRIQFNKDYNFRDFKKNIDYLSRLGIGSVYASPVFEAAPGSMHGYDVANPEIINPEIGKYSDFEEISDRLKLKNIGWIQDIVPNHMAFHMKNAWLMDVLEKGVSSKYYEFFDIDFSHPDFKGKVMIPFLGKELEEVIRDGEIVAEWHKNIFVFRYFDFWFPFSYESFISLIDENISKAPENFSTLWNEFKLHRNKETFPENEWSQLKDKAGKLYAKSAPFKNFVEEVLKRLNDEKDLLEAALSNQHYFLTYWNESSDRLNYRRFFTINSLICLKMENDVVFETYHRLIEKQVLNKRFDGLRIDHVDGLKLPLYYIDKLRLISGDDTYIVTEKILQKDEEMMPDLPIQGTSGYDYLGMVNNLFTFKKNYPLFRKFYRKITGIKTDFADIVYNKKKFILTWRMNAEWDNLTRLFEESGFMADEPEITVESAKDAIGEFLIFFPVYKLYSDHLPLNYEDQKILEEVFEKAVNNTPSLKKPINVLRNVFLSQDGFDEDKKKKALDFFLRCMQFTGPLMA
jgi:malto-oligosyltrehalose synthase